VTYAVVRRDALSYVTTDVDEILKERNGSETALRDVVLVVDHGEDVRIRLAFSDDGVELDAGANDRAKLLLLASDLRALARDRMRGRGGETRNRYVQQLIIPVLLLVCGALFLGLSERVRDNQSDAYDREVAAYRIESDRLAEAEKAEAVVAERTAERLLSGGTLEEQIDFLVQREGAAANEEANRPSFPEFPDIGDPLYLGLPGLLLSFMIAGLLALAARFVLAPAAEHVFLLGDEIARRQKRDKLRQNVIWGVGVAFAVGVLSSLAVTLFG